MLNYPRTITLECNIRGKIHFYDWKKILLTNKRKTIPLAHYSIQECAKKNSFYDAIYIIILHKIALSNYFQNDSRSYGFFICLSLLTCLFICFISIKTDCFALLKFTNKKQIFTGACYIVYPSDLRANIHKVLYMAHYCPSSEFTIKWVLFGFWF